MSESKGNDMNDQTAKADAGKIKPSLVPMEGIRAVAHVREFGTSKYGDPDNWKRVEPQRYLDALWRHLMAYTEDPLSVDDESGFNHMDHVATNAFFLIAMGGGSVKRQ